MLWNSSILGYRVTDVCCLPTYSRHSSGRIEFSKNTDPVKVVLKILMANLISELFDASIKTLERVYDV